jgi:uncharacterized protein YbjT (DUF2867 family)
VPELLAVGHLVRCMARDPGKLSDRPWSGDVEIAAADALEGTGVRRALEGVEVAYYLIHSLGTGASFEQRDREAAGIFADAAMSAGVKRIVYLGGIVPAGGSGLSPHLHSRAEVGDILLGGGVPVAALQAAVIIGSGSASFEMLRYLTERLPVMVTPKWVETRIQPIAVHDVLHYLVGCAALPAGVSRRFDIGGPDVLTYAEMMRQYSEAAGLPPRVLVPVPLLTPRLSSLWVGLVTPVPAGLAMPLVESLRNEVVCSEHDIASYVPDPPEGLMPLDRAIALALRHTREGAVSTRWSSAATPGAPSDPLPSDPSWAGGSLYVDARISAVRASPAALWRVIEGIGGETGWYSFPAAWAVRGMLDRLAGGVGLRRGRRDPRHLLVGDALDFWRVEAITPGSLLRLRAEMKLPGLAWLEMAVGQDHDGMTTYSQRAIFQPRGLAGHAYWRSISPFHGVVFGGMLRNITAAAERAGRAADKPALARHWAAWQTPRHLRAQRIGLGPLVRLHLGYAQRRPTGPPYVCSDRYLPLPRAAGKTADFSHSSAAFRRTTWANSSSLGALTLAAWVVTWLVRAGSRPVTVAVFADGRRPAGPASQDPLSAPAPVVQGCGFADHAAGLVVVAPDGANGRVRCAAQAQRVRCAAQALGCAVADSGAATRRRAAAPDGERRAAVGLA